MVRLGALGDVALTTGVLEYWRRERDLRFTVITRQAFAPLFEGHPAVDRVVGVAPETLSLPRLVSLWRELAQEYAGQGLLDLHGTPRSFLLARFWQGQVRRFPKLALERRLFLLARQAGALPGAQWLETRNRDALERWTVPQRYALALEESAPPVDALLPLMVLDAEEQARADSQLREAWPQGVEKAAVALHPYATHANKAWPAHRWLELTKLLDAARIPWFVVGAAKKRVMDVPPERDFTSRTTLRETCALLARAGVLITGDSGPMHLASAVGTPVVALFGPTTSQWGFFPQGPKDTVLETDMPCRPCSLHGSAPCPHGLRCLEDIDAVRVMQAVETIVG